MFGRTLRDYTRKLTSARVASPLTGCAFSFRAPDGTSQRAGHWRAIQRFDQQFTIHKVKAHQSSLRGDRELAEQLR
eukprot:6771960-Pyramimonas_sp.AAC.1